MCVPESSFVAGLSRDCARYIDLLLRASQFTSRIPEHRTSRALQGIPRGDRSRFAYDDGGDLQIVGSG